MAVPAAETVAYAYDDAGRLTNAAYSGGANIAYAYDAAGNLLMRTVTEGGATTYTLIYRAGSGGSIVGVATQVVAEGQSGTPVEAVADDGSAVFHAWSDGAEANPRTDAEVMADLTVIASFLSQGGADLDWYAARGIAPEPGEDWTDVDARAVAGKGTTLRHENIVDTDPGDPEDRFRVIRAESGPPVVVQFRPGSPERLYSFQTTDDLENGEWVEVPGVAPRPGEGEGAVREDEMEDPNDPPAGPFYRIEVQVP
jgi:YD repeat-containing protein